MSIRRRLQSVLWRVPLEQEVREELAHHVELRTEELVARGVDPIEARRQAAERLGDPARITSALTDLGRRRDHTIARRQWWSELRQDLARPVGYDGTAPLSNTNSNFLNGGLFPGSFVPNTPCNNPNPPPGGNPNGCNTIFTTVFDPTNDPFDNPPGVGRNSFFGPKYFVTDISVGKRFGLWSETSGLDLRFNLFNLFNQLNFAPFGANSNPTHADRSQFGIPTNGLSGRVGEFQARLSF